MDLKQKLSKYAPKEWGKEIRRRVSLKFIILTEKLFIVLKEPAILGLVQGAQVQPAGHLPPAMKINPTQRRDGNFGPLPKLSPAIMSETPACALHHIFRTKNR